MRWVPLLALSLAACGDKDDTDTAAAEPLPDYSAAGSYTPVTFEAEITGSTGVPLTIQAWFPSEETDDDEVRYDELYPSGAQEGLPAACDTPRPVLVFSHGYGGLRWQSAFFTEHLASHGYIVAAPDHTYNTTFDNDDERFEEVVERRPLDIRDTFDWLVAQSEDADSPLHGCVDAADGYAVSGHSFGGYTTYAVAGAALNGLSGLADDRVWAALPMAPWNAGGVITDGNAAITVPVMTLTGARDETTPLSMVTALHDALTVEPRYFGELPEAGHYSFAPIACDVYGDGDGCGDDFLDLEVLTALVRTAGLAFLEESRGVTGAIEQLPAASDDLLWTSAP